MKFLKLKLSPTLLKLAYLICDVEASGEAACLDGRIVEYSFVIGKLGSKKPGKVLDVGCTARLNYLPGALASLGWRVSGIDLREFKFKHPNFCFIRGDIRHTDFPDNFFDAVYAVSTIEHLGLSGRYGVTGEDPEADMKAVAEIARILRAGGSFLVTLPYGKKRKLKKPMKKVYDKESLRKLFSGWEIKDKIIYAQDNEGFWVPLTEQEIKEDKEAIVLLEAQKPIPIKKRT